MATTTSLDLRSDFPILRGEIAYLDSAATSQKPEVVIEAMNDYYRTSNANIHRSVYELAVKATEGFEGAREKVAEFVGWEVPTTIFTSNASAAVNLVAYSWAMENLREGDEILVTEMDHHSNIVPWQLAARRTGAKLRWWPLEDDFTLSLDRLDEELSRGSVKLVAAVHVSNVLGTINPVAEIAARARAAGAISVIDGSQAVPQLPVNLREIDADFYVWTGHKALGPTGIGVLHGRRELLEAMPPFLGGGHMISVVGDQESSYSELPWKYEAGTSNIAEAWGLGAAIDYLSSVGMDAVRAHEAELTSYALEQLPEVPGLTIFGPSDLDKRGGTVSFEVEGLHPHDLAELLGRDNVCIRAGHHCAQPLMRRLGVPATARASFHVYNGRQDVDKLVEALHTARKVFQL